MRLLKNLVVLCALAAAFALPGRAGEPPGPAPTAADLAARLSAIRQEGANYLRVRLEIQAGAADPTALQLQIKVRRAARTTDAVYQVLFPKDRRGEAVLLHHPGGRPPSGVVFLPASNALRPLDPGQMKDPLFGSGLSYEDLVDNFYAWGRQALAGTEMVGGVNCLVLESRPDKEDWTDYGSVRSWIDPVRLVPLRVEKYLPSNKLARRIETTRFAKDGQGRVIPASLTVRQPGRDEVTTLEGSRSESGVVYADAEFTPEGIRQLSPPPRAASE